jgi:DNA-binding response OmpR family regulator
MPNQSVVMVIDDDEMLQAIVGAKLKLRGYRVIPVVEGAQAAEAVRRERPDILLLDMMMPGIDGLEVLREVKADPAMADVPVVMLTARRQEADIVSCLKAGAADYMVKPFIPEELAMRIQRLLPRSAA